MTGTIRRGRVIRADLANWNGLTPTSSRVDATGGTTSGLAIGNEVDVLQVYGSGTDRVRASVLNAVNTISTTSVSLVFAPGTWTIDDNTTIPANFTCRIPAGCVFSVSSGKTLTFSGLVIVEYPSSWTTGSGTVTSLNTIPTVRTAAEITAGVTPTNFSFEPGDVRRYGAVGDGSTDNTTALRNTASALAAGGTMTFEPAGIYMFDPVGSSLGITFSSKSGFKVAGNGATIRAIAGAEVDGGNQLFYFTGCSDGLIENLTLDGNRANRTISSDVTAANVQITTSCARLKFSRVRSINSCEDGWYVNTATEGTQSTYPTDVVLENCEGYNAYRNNISVIGSVRFTIRGGYWHGANGTDPEAGIDLEPNSTTTYGNTDVLVEDVVVSDNTRHGITMGVSSGAPVNTRVTLRNIRGSLNGLSFIRVGSAVAGLDIDGAWCGPHSADITRGLVDLGSATSITDVSLRNLHFSEITSTLSGSRSLIYLHGTITERISIDGVTVRNSTLPLLVGEAAYQLSNVNARNFDIGTGNAVINTATASRCVLRDIRIEDSQGYGAVIANPDTDIDGMTLIDCASTVASLYLVSGATDPIVKNVSVYQTVSIPAGQSAIRFDIVPKVVRHIQAKSAGTDYTTANIFNFSAGIVTSSISDCRPSATESSGTGSVASGATTAVITHGLGVTPALKDISITWGEQGSNDYGRWSVGTITSTQFTVTVAADPGASNLDFGWSVRVRP